MEPMMLDSENLRKELRLSVESGRMIIYLGAEVSSTRPRNLLSDRVWRPAALRYQAILAHYAREDPELAATTAVAREVAITHGLGELNEAGTTEDPVFELARAVAEGLHWTLLGAYERMAAAMNERTQSDVRRARAPRDIADVAVDLSDRDHHGRKASIELTNAVRAAALLKETDVRPPLHPEAIARRLAILVACTGGDRRLGDLSSSLGSRGAFLDETLEVIERGSIRALTSTDIEWLQDLLWHVLRHDVEAYPTREELAFQLGLLLPKRASAPHRRTPLSTVALKVDDEQLVTALQDSIHFWERGSPSKTHHTLAKLLSHQFATYAQAATIRRGSSAALVHRKKRELDSDPKDSRGPLPPMVIATTYDRGIERALTSLDQPHHVVFPILIQKGNVGQSDGWAIRTYSLTGPTGFEAIEGSGDLPRSLVDLRGPVVVRIRGAPAEPLDSVEAIDGEADEVRYRHAPHIGEKVRLEKLLNPDRLPKWITPENVLGKGPPISAWFVGFPFDAWDEKLDVFQAHHLSSEARKAQHFAVYRKPEDASVEGLFDKLETKMFTTEISIFEDLLAQVLRGLKP